MRRSFKYQLRPTQRQAMALASMLADHCTLYNAALQERIDAYRHASRTSIRYIDQSAQLKDIRTLDSDQSRWSFSSQQATLRRLDKGMQAFFRRVKAGQAPGFPRYRGYGWFNTVEFPKDGDGCRWNSTPTNGQSRVRLQGIGHVKVNLHRPIQGVVKTISVKREGRKWFVVVSCDDIPSRPLPLTGSVIGLDLATGSNGLAYTSNGERIDNPMRGRRAAAKLAAAQQALARCMRGSNRRQGVRERVARLHAKIARQRLDHAHKVALDLVRENDFIAVEALLIQNMTRRARPKPDLENPGQYLPNGQAAKTGLNKSILDAGWGVFLNVLHAKAESAGRTVVEVNPANTSRTCSACAHVKAENRVGKAFLCLACGHTADADVNAAVNILRVGLTLREPLAA